MFFHWENTEQNVRKFVISYCPSFTHIPFYFQWIPEIQFEEPNASFILVGCKHDLRQEYSLPTSPETSSTLSPEYRHTVPKSKVFILNTLFLQHFSLNCYRCQTVGKILLKKHSKSCFSNFLNRWKHRNSC